MKLEVRGEQKCKSMRFENNLWDKVKDEAIRLNMTQNGLVRAILIGYFEDKTNNSNSEQE